MWTRRGSWTSVSILVAVLTAALGVTPNFGAAHAGPPWKIHDMSRPEASVVTPGATASQPPSDAIVLFDGSNLDAWKRQGSDREAGWEVENGYMKIAGYGGIETKQAFGDCQLHIEFATPGKVEGSSQGRGNSGVFFLGAYEIQVLDSYGNHTYADGHAGSIYGQYAPLVNASRPPGEWQSYDIVFRGPRFTEDGTLKTPAYFTVLHNGVLVQDHVALSGPTPWLNRPPYTPGPDRGPIALQHHGNPLRFRNIWVRELPEIDPLDDARIVPEIENAVTVPAEILEQYAGRYQGRASAPAAITLENGVLFAKVATQDKFALFSLTETVFVPQLLDARFEFSQDDQGAVSLQLTIGGDAGTLRKKR